MTKNFLQIAATPAVARAQAHYYGRAMPLGGQGGTDGLGEEERAFIAARDSFYLSTVSESGWPYVQHRGGPAGFLRVTGPTTLVFADFTGNRQLLSTGNIAANDRVALFLMDYPGRTRLKILGRARVEDVRARPELVAAHAEPEFRRVAERLFVIDVVSFDWNCPKFITPRYTVAEIEEATAPLRQRIADLEAQLKPRISSGP